MSLTFSQGTKHKAFFPEKLIGALFHLLPVNVLQTRPRRKRTLRAALLQRKAVHDRERTQQQQHHGAAPLPVLEGTLAKLHYRPSGQNAGPTPQMVGTSQATDVLTTSCPRGQPFVAPGGKSKGCTPVSSALLSLDYRRQGAMGPSQTL